VEQGFSVSVDHADYPVTMPAARWLAMVRGRFWSNFNGFTDEEVEAGVREIKGRLGIGGEEDEEEEQRAITFPDRIVFIVGEKK
jgi:hypothetical protein